MTDARIVADPGSGQVCYIDDAAYEWLLQANEREGEEQGMKKCMYCGKEGTAPHVRGAKSASVGIGNFRVAENIDVEPCDNCADEVMGAVIRELLLQLQTTRGAE